MSIVDSQNSKILTYPPSSVARAERSLICSPFKLELFETMRRQSVPLGAIASENGVKNSYSKKPLSELACDNALGWLIEVGILRREVDGQGITDSFRLTPLGHQIVEKYQSQNLPNPSWRDRLYNAITRWLRSPF
ncbi:MULTISPECIES: Npun_F0494 family protein [unclassified Anabaena]|uniref:Npun_F0494 family protein n=1 Tax=unclassified Anabaena TaxID=2619674 RepID=UPI00082F294C|nr:MULTISPECIES: Npun_F0494 family protein [unclassified Anabaena]